MLYSHWAFATSRIAAFWLIISLFGYQTSTCCAIPISSSWSHNNRRITTLIIFIILVTIFFFFFAPYVVAIFYRICKPSKLLPHHLMYLYLIRLAQGSSTILCSGPSIIFFKPCRNWAAFLVKTCILYKDSILVIQFLKLVGCI
uniref:Uncharacterized protein n=1 Tax=Sipha flava TaxID=143950 RepID=A0A2S2R3M9_9HEMI